MSDQTHKKLGHYFRTWRGSTEKITGNSLDSSLEKLENVRKDTLEELAKREDDWLMKVDKEWTWGPTNNYCKWFMCVSINQIITVSSNS